MPDAAQILTDLQAIVNQGRTFSPFIRFVLLALVGLFIYKRRIWAGWLAVYAAVLMLAVAAMSVAFEDHFLAVPMVIFGLLGVLWGREALTLPPRARWSGVRAGLAVVVGLCAFFYPHFVEGAWGAVLFAPLGVLPCPTLIFANAAVIAAGRSYQVYTVLPTWIMGAFFGLVGVFYLGVAVDWMLVGAAVVSAAAWLSAKEPQPRAGKRARRGA